MIAAVLLHSLSAWAEGDFYVIGTGKVGTRITGVPMEINKPGFYFFTGDLIYKSDSGNAITPLLVANGRPSGTGSGRFDVLPVTSRPLHFING
jgi:hypothetical protein